MMGHPRRYTVILEPLEEGGSRSGMMGHPRRYTVILEPLEEGGFNVRVPALPEVVTFGGTEREALAMAEDAIGLAISYRLDHGEPVPDELKPEVREVTVAL